MNRRSFLSTLGLGALAAVLPVRTRAALAPIPGYPRRLTFTTAGTMPASPRLAVIRGLDLHGNDISETIVYFDDGREMVSRLSYREFSLTLPALEPATPIPFSFGTA